MKKPRRKKGKFRQTASKKWLSMIYTAAAVGSIVLAFEFVFTEIAYLPFLSYDTASGVGSLMGIIVLFTGVFQASFLIKLLGGTVRACKTVFVVCAVLPLLSIAALFIHDAKLPAALSDVPERGPVEVRVSVKPCFYDETGQEFHPFYMISLNLDGQIYMEDYRRVISRYSRTRHSTHGSIMTLDFEKPYSVLLRVSHDYHGKQDEWQGRTETHLTLTPEELRDGYQQKFQLQTEDGSTCVVQLTLQHYVSFWEVVLH